MKFLIPTEPDDTHAILVKIALEQQGHDVRLLFTADQPTKQKNSVSINDEDYQWRTTDAQDSIGNETYDVVWSRRVRKPYLPKTSTHPDDYQFALKENILFYESITHNMAPNAWWVNSKEGARNANSKLLQLRLAKQCGLTIPSTLCSNNPNDIRRFLLNHENCGVIYKPLCSSSWFEKDRIKIAYTNKISLTDLPDDTVLQCTPGLFQREISKKYELRVTCFGDYVLAAKLNSQAHKEGLIDWRAIPDGKMQVEHYQLPHEIEDKIRDFMHRIGIVFGTFDFIVTPDDRYVFLEVNEQGQFLWLEDYNSQLPMLDVFVNFLISKSAKFTWDPHRYMHSIDQYKYDMQSIVTENLQHHVDINRVSM